MQIRYQKILDRKFKYKNGEDIPQSKIAEILINATGDSNSTIINNPDKYLEGKSLLDFNKLLKELKASSS